MYKVGLIGLGAVGFYYQNGREAENLTHFNSINSNPNLELVCGIDLKRPPNWPHSIDYFSDIADINIKCDLVIIASPTHTHVNIVEKICTSDYPPKLLLLEKPAGKTVSDIAKINQISRSSNIPIFVNFFRDCFVEDMRKIVPYEKVTLIKINFTGTLLNTGYHFLHFAKMIMRDQLKVLNTIRCRGNIVYFCKLGTVDLIAFERGNTKVPENTITFYTETTKVLYDNENNTINFFGITKNTIYAEEDIYSIEKIMSASLDQGFGLVYEDIVKALRGQPCKLPSVADVECFRREFEYAL